MFDAGFRATVHDFVLTLARADERVTAAAVVGSLAESDGDRWSDLDLTFGVRAEDDMSSLLSDWADRLRIEYDADRLFDVRSGPSVYRVFLLPGGLQVDLSVAPELEFGARG